MATPIWNHPAQNVHGRIVYDTRGLSGAEADAAIRAVADNAGAPDAGSPMIGVTVGLELAHSDV